VAFAHASVAGAVVIAVVGAHALLAGGTSSALLAVAGAVEARAAVRAILHAGAQGAVEAHVTGGANTLALHAVTVVVAILRAQDCLARLANEAGRQWQVPL